MTIISTTTLLLSGTGCTTGDDGKPNPAPEAIPTRYTGPEVAVGDGLAWTLVETDESLNPVAIGIQFEESALVNLPAGSPHADEFVLQLPEDLPVAPYDHITLDWNEHGHEPMQVYDLPHFDIHLYFMSMSQRNAIAPTDSLEFNKPLPEDHLPPMYLETPGGVPRMGAHIIDLLSPEIAGTGTFTHTFIYGKYDGQLNFLEPMVTKAFLESKTQVDQAIRHPSSWQESGYYPSGYTIAFDSETGLYTILLTGLEEF